MPPPPKPRDVEVRVILTPSEDPKWRIDSPLLEDKKLVFRNNHHPGFDVFFVIEDPENSGYQFPDDKDKALAATPVAEGEGENVCPGRGVSWPQFKPKAVIKNAEGRNTTLQVRNPNAPGQEAEFRYTLFLTLKPAIGDPCWELDPGGLNKNGSIS